MGISEEAEDASHQIVLHGEIGREKSVSLAIVTYRLAFARAQHAQRIHLMIDSIGGKVDEAFAIYTALRSYPGALSAVAHGFCCSAAVIVLLAADHRVLKRGTKVLLHGARRMNAADCRRHVESVEATNARMLDLFAMRTGSPRDLFATEILTEEDLAEEAALAWGLVHEIEEREWPRPMP
jgi:ATP-dependent protease ClpP protease subunit